MKFNEALKILGIERYSERIFNSNSRGELMHLFDYIVLAESLKTTDWFSDWFDETVKYAQENWDRPESVFQHINKILFHQMENH